MLEEHDAIAATIIPAGMVELAPLYGSTTTGGKLGLVHTVGFVKRENGSTVLGFEGEKAFSQKAVIDSAMTMVRDWDFGEGFFSGSPRGPDL